jgi:Flp pilus assembly protein TadD
VSKNKSLPFAHSKVLPGCAAIRLSIKLFLLAVIFFEPIVPIIGLNNAQRNRKGEMFRDPQITSQAAKRAYDIPSSLNITGRGNAESFLDPKTIPGTSYCGHCHQQAYREWRQSLHANSFRTAFYRASDDLLIEAKGKPASKYCDRCHDPTAVLSGALDPNSKIDRSFDEDGVSCINCHSIESVEPKLGNGSYKMAGPAVMVDEEGNRIPGIVPDAEILAHLDRHKKAVMQDLYRKPKFCSACHKASLPPELNNYKWLRSFTAYDEWQDSMFSHENPLTFYQANYASCQDCHMRPEPLDNSYGDSRSHTFPSHRWIAGNTAVPFKDGHSEQLDKTITFLKSGRFISVDLFALQATNDARPPTPIGAAPITLRPGEVVQAYVVIQNKGIGHSFIPELRDLFEAWVRLTVKDVSGKIIYESGFLKPDGTLDPYAHAFMNLPMDVAGNFIDKHMVWNEHAEGYDHTIQSGHSDLVRYQFRIPEKLKGPITITAGVEYRHFRQGYLNFVLGKDHPAYPVVEIASRSQTFRLGTNPHPKLLPTDNPEWKRWNNFGIALLDQQQFNDAARAFEQVIRLRPGYKDGYINLGFTYIQAGKFTEARDQLRKALKLKTGDARGLYYLAQVERHDKQPGAEIANLEKVVAQYPQCRDARRDLGTAYEDQNRTREALAQFQALQVIDPDDLEAHHHLAGIYRRIGMMTEASAEEAQYNKQKADPGAPTYSQDFLREHPQIVRESVLSHVHSDSNSPLQAITPAEP